jgi:hypothetical protein
VYFFLCLKQRLAFFRFRRFYRIVDYAFGAFLRAVYFPFGDAPAVRDSREKRSRGGSRHEYNGYDYPNEIGHK